MTSDTVSVPSCRPPRRLRGAEGESAAEILARHRLRWSAYRDACMMQRLMWHATLTSVSARSRHFLRAFYYTGGAAIQDVGGFE